MLRRDNAIRTTTVTARAIAAVSATTPAVRQVHFYSRLAAILVGCLIGIQAIAQCRPVEMPLAHGEAVGYDVYFKWGMLMPYAGHARIGFDRTTFRGAEASRYRLLFQTSKFFDAVMRMRDTLDCYYNADFVLLHGSKRVNEGGYRLTDELTFNASGGRTLIHSRRYTPTQVKIDTTMAVGSGCVTDMLGAIFHLRTSVDWKTLKPGNSFPLTVAIGRDLIRIRLRYRGPATLQHNGTTWRTHYFVIDIDDNAFERRREAAELWVGDDLNRLPVKIRSKLKVGYAEVYYNNASRLKYPLTCRQAKR